MNRVVQEVLQRHRGASRDALIPILQEVQERVGYVSRDAVSLIGRHLGLAPSKIYGVATFYNQFRFQAPGRHRIQVCRGTACHVKGSAELLDTLVRTLGIQPGQTTRDGAFSLEVVACMGACGLAPVICVDGEFFGGVTPDMVGEILDRFRRKDAREEAGTGQAMGRAKEVG